jgi:hypothetical protein
MRLDTDSNRVYNFCVKLWWTLSRDQNSFKVLMICKPDFYGDVIYKLGKILGHSNIPAAFTKSIKRLI